MQNAVCPLVNNIWHLNITTLREEDQVQRRGFEVVLTLAIRHGTRNTILVGKLSSNPQSIPDRQYHENHGKFPYKASVEGFSMDNFRVNINQP